MRPRAMLTVSAAALSLSLGAGAFLDRTGAAFSDVTQNPGSSFSAAGSFCTSPGTQTFLADADTYVDQQRSNDNYGSALTLELRSATNRNRRVLVHVTLPAVQYCTVTAATLRLNLSVGLPGRTLEAYRVTGPWAESGVTWNTQPPYTGPAAAAPSGTGWVQFDVTSQVQTMLGGPNDGFLVKDMLESQNPATASTFTSREALLASPELVITLA